MHPIIADDKPFTYYIAELSLHNISKMLVCQQSTMSHLYQGACHGVQKGLLKDFSSSVGTDDNEASPDCIPSNNDQYSNTNRFESSSKLQHVDAEEDEVDQRMDHPTKLAEYIAINHHLQSSLEVLQTSPFSDPFMHKQFSSSTVDYAVDDNTFHIIESDIHNAEKNAGASNRVYSLHEKCCSKDEHTRLKMFNNYRDTGEREDNSLTTTMIANLTIEEKLSEFKSFWASL